MSAQKSCILVYNPISGHGHLDSWNAIIVGLLLENGWQVLAMTPDRAALRSRLALRGVQTKNLELLDWDASRPGWARNPPMKILHQAWRRWDHFGSRYFHQLKGSQATPDMPVHIRMRKRLFQVVMPFVYRATHFILRRWRAKRGCIKGPLDGLELDMGPDSDSESGWLDPVEFGTRVNAALVRSRRKPQVIINMYLDAYRNNTRRWMEFESIINLPWVGIRFVPADVPSEIYYSLASFRGMCFLDEEVCRSYRRHFPDKQFDYLADFTETAVPRRPGSLVREIRRRAAGRKIVFLGGSITCHKNLARWYELVAIADAKRWFFVQVGELHSSTFTEEDIIAYNKIMSDQPEHLLVFPEYLPDERNFNEVIAASDVIFAVYRDFRISSNMLAKAAAFEKPILVATGHLMDHRVNAYGIGKSVPFDSAADMLRALESLEDPITLKKRFADFQRDFDAHSMGPRLDKFVERALRISCVPQCPVE